MRVESEETQVWILPFQDRIAEIASQLQGIAAVVECMNRGAADNIKASVASLLSLSQDLRAAAVRRADH